MTILANADTIQIAQQLMIHPTLRDKIVEEAKPAGPGQPTSALTAQQNADLASLTGWANEFRTSHHLEACQNPNLRAGLTEEDCGTQSEAQARANPQLAATWNNNAFPGMRLFSKLTFSWLWMVVPVHPLGWVLTTIAASL